jgi:hypothetical protein
VARAAGGGDLVTSTARVKLATSGHIRTHRLLQNSLSITAGTIQAERRIQQWTQGIDGVSENVLRKYGREMERGNGSHTELAPKTADGSGADEVGGVVEEVEDTGGGVEADPVEEVPAAALLHLHRRWPPRVVVGARGGAVQCPKSLVGGGGEECGREGRRKGNRPSFGGAVAAFVQILLRCLWPPNGTDSSPPAPPRRSVIAFLASNHHARSTRAMPRCSCPPTPPP